MSQPPAPAPAPASASGPAAPPVLRRHLTDSAQTEALGASLAAALLQRDLPPLLITLHGDLGAGKTTLVRGLLRALGVAGRIKSPSYALVEPYAIDKNCLEFRRRIQTQVYHVDLYRFSSPDEWTDAGLDDLLAGHAVCLVEWPEHAGGLLPTADVSIALNPAEGGRDAELRAGTAAGGAVLEILASAPTDAP